LQGPVPCILATTGSISNGASLFVEHALGSAAFTKATAEELGIDLKERYDYDNETHEVNGE